MRRMAGFPVSISRLHPTGMAGAESNPDKPIHFMVNFDNSGFSEEQTSYLSGFISGMLESRKLPFLGQDATRRFTHEPEASVATVFGTPLEDLCKEERIKHEKHGLDCFDTIIDNSTSGSFPQGDDIFRYKYHGLFFVSPAQESLMLRCRVAGGAITAGQFRGLAGIARDWGNSHGDLTTRANIQVREILPENAPAVLMKLADLGLTSLGAGADNIRNITATPTTGFDPCELIDVMPYAHALHHYILKNRDLYGLPRKFNIAYDSGGLVSVCADTNDIGFQAVRVKETRDGVMPGIYFRMQLCGITGHKQFASDCGVLLTPAETLPVAAALIRVFIENGDRTNRKKARLKYLVDDWGVPRTLDEVQKKLTFPLRRLPLAECEVASPKQKHGHLGIHPQTDGKFYIGVGVPVGRLTAVQMEALADIAECFGRGEIRLTVWQNLLIPGVSADRLDAARKALQACGLSPHPGAVSGGLVACTGSRGCKYAAADTKGHAKELGAWLDQRVPLDVPINIHFTGCQHSCAQHYIGDIGLMGVKVKSASGESLEAYHIYLGGGVDDQQAIGREIWKSVVAGEVPALLETLLRVYLELRFEGESFTNFTARHSPDSLRDLTTASAST